MPAYCRPYDHHNHPSRILDAIAGIDETFDDFDQEDIENLLDEMRSKTVRRRTSKEH